MSEIYYCDVRSDKQMLVPAIICAPALIDDRYAESEYIVDRRRLVSVRIVQRFRQLTQREFDQLRKARSAES